MASPSTNDDVPLSLRVDLSTAMKVDEVMTWQVETVEAEEPAATAATVMLENKYGCLPVVEQGSLVGY